ncbi:PRDM7_9 [Mytilus edulis]|uniref:PRDM7_9 n=1 Tax=Mytilus edulis TaxID=6550 RepID=A0A8S3QPV8_MYTED|nr:PRDM7_9 [Mytilus edulis]
MRGITGRADTGDSTVITRTYTLQSDREKFTRGRESDKCLLCETSREDTHHFLITCAALKTERDRHLSVLKSYLKNNFDRVEEQALLVLFILNPSATKFKELFKLKKSNYYYSCNSIRSGEIPRLVEMDKKDFQKFEEDERSGDIDQYFTKMQLANLSAYETLRYRNMKKNYEMMVKMGLPAQKPEFMKALKQKQIVKNTNESGFDEIRKPSSDKVKRHQGQTVKDLSKSKLETKKKKKVTQRIDSDSDEEWRPSSEKRKKNPAFEVPKKRIRKEKNEQNNLNSDDENVDGVSDEREETGKSGSHRYPQRKIPLTNYMYLEVPDDDEFIYCEDCEREYEGDCPVHPCIPIFDSQTTSKDESRAVNTLPDGLSVKESRIPNAGLGVFADKTFQSRCKFGPYQGEITRDAEIAHYTGYAWQIYLDGDPNHFIDALDKSKSNWMRYVNCARNEDEQNLIAYQYKGDIYYRSFKDIEPGNELLVWYGQDYGKDLGIERLDITSLLKPKYINGEAIYRCPLCTVGFSHERYISNHLKYHHSTKLEWLLNPSSSKTNIIVQYQCGICSMSFGHSNIAKQHHKICHGQDIIENIIRIHKLHNEDSSSLVQRSNMQFTVGQQPFMTDYYKLLLLLGM